MCKPLGAVGAPDAAVRGPARARFARAERAAVLRESLEGPID